MSRGRFCGASPVSAGTRLSSAQGFGHLAAGATSRCMSQSMAGTGRVCDRDGSMPSGLPRIMPDRTCGHSARVCRQPGPANSGHWCFTARGPQSRGQQTLARSTNHSPTTSSSAYWPWPGSDPDPSAALGLNRARQCRDRRWERTGRGAWVLMAESSGGTRHMMGVGLGAVAGHPTGVPVGEGESGARSCLLPPKWRYFPPGNQFWGAPMAAWMSRQWRTRFSCSSTNRFKGVSIS